MKEEEASFAMLSDSGENPTLRLGTLGAALNALEDLVRRSGISFYLNTPEGIDESAKVAPLVGEVDRAKILVDLAITQAILYGNAEKCSIGFLSMPQSAAFKQGNIVALYCVNKKSFLRLRYNKADYGGGQRVDPSGKFCVSSSAFPHDRPRVSEIFVLDGGSFLDNEYFRPKILIL